MDIARLDAIGLNTDDGLAYCADDPEFYEEMLGEYVAEADGTAAEIERAFGASDWGAYAVRVHALKSSSRIIGAGAFAETAYELEMAAKHTEAEKIQRLHGDFISEFRDLTGNICEILK